MYFPKIFGKNKQQGLGSFERKFYDWVNKGLSKKLPKNINAYCFNLHQYPWFAKTDPLYGVELIGAPVFDMSDPDWPCNEIFETKPRSIKIPYEYSAEHYTGNSRSGEHWKECLEKMKKLVTAYLATNETGASILNAADGIGIGFVDGQVHNLPKGSKIWQECE